MTVSPTIGSFPGGIVVQVLERGPMGQIDPADRDRFDRAADLGETIESRMASVAASEEAALAASSRAQSSATQAQNAARTAATDAAQAIAPATAQAIRDQVKADADRAAEVLATVSLGVVSQRDDGTWPARPAVPVVLFLGWDSPGALMQPPDLWFAPEEYPGAPAQIVDADWRLFNAMDGSRAVLRLLQGPAVARPGVLGYDYRFTYTNMDGVQVVTDPLPFPIVPGDNFITVPDPANGRVYAMEISARNIQGRGPWSVLQAVTISDQPFTDSFDRIAGQKIHAAGGWENISSNAGHGLVIGAGGTAQNSARSRNEAALVNLWLPDDQFVEAVIQASEPTDWRNSVGVSLLLRATTANAGYSLIVSNTGWTVRTVPMGGSSGTNLGSGTFPAGTVLPVKARLQAVGSTISVLLNDVVVFTTTSTKYTKGRSGLLMYQASAKGIIDNFRTGPAA